MVWFANFVLLAACVPILVGAINGDFIVTAVGVATFAVGLVILRVTDER